MKKVINKYDFLLPYFALAQTKTKIYGETITPSSLLHSYILRTEKGKKVIYFGHTFFTHKIFKKRKFIKIKYFVFLDSNKKAQRFIKLNQPTGIVSTTYLNITVNGKLSPA